MQSSGTDIIICEDLHELLAVFNSLYCDNWSGVVCSTESVL